MAFILPKMIIREIEKCLRSFLRKGSTGVGYAKVSWHQVCWPIEEGGLGIRDLLALNRGLMSWHLWRIISGDRSSLWVDWISHYRLREHLVWTVSDRSGSWGWRKLVRLRAVIRPFIEYRIGSGSSFLLWHDPWHELGPLITRFPLGPRHSSTLPMASLDQAIVEGAWSWPPITNMESIEITHSLPVIHGGEDRILWRDKGVPFPLQQHMTCSTHQEHNCRIFRQTSRTPLDIARSTVNEIRDLIISTELPHTVSSRGLYRLWQIPWPVEGDAAS
ncbi:UNVERIFIED_CONTAM: hypothetical protein Slati_2219700 [Sesamum latifolium]|uniref:Reverse transcriptase zinc-binding domain-containing protein n=1 Tax=Sesamum latifolium TaxID=2727402 RepID=A0AAW2WTK5_9LAMI